MSKTALLLCVVGVGLCLVGIMVKARENILVAGAFAYALGCVWLALEPDQNGR